MSINIHSIQWYVHFNDHLRCDEVHPRIVFSFHSQTPLASRYFCEVRSWRTNIQMNVNGSAITTSSPNHQITLPVGSSSSASSSAIASFITAQNPTLQKKEACVLVCTSIEHPKAHCPPTLGQSFPVSFILHRTFLSFQFSSCRDVSLSISDSVSW